MARYIQTSIALTLFVTLLVGICPFNTKVVYSQPIVKDSNLKVDLLTKGLKSPTSMAFVGPNDILVTEKTEGTVKRVVNGNVLPQPLLQVPVATMSERGILGIDVAKHENGSTYVFLYYTESGGRKTGDDITNGVQPSGNVVYRYELVGNNHLVHPKLLLHIPAIPGPFHDGGKVAVGPDNNVYVVIGDLRSHRTLAENVINGPPADKTGGILRITQDGQVVPNPPLGNTSPLNLYYAYGIRNSFGIGFDPITGKLWDTENGPRYADEINLVNPGFNSGWAQVMGIWTPKGKIADEDRGQLNLHPSHLVDFGGKGKYRLPEFTWVKTVAPTALTFLNSSKLGKQYQNDLFVGDFNNGNIYHFKLNTNRTSLSFSDDKLKDKIAYSPQDLKSLIFASGFGKGTGITDLKVGPKDGYLYVLTLGGFLFKISSSSLGSP